MTKSRGTLRIAAVGPGGMARRHLTAVSKMTGVEVVGVCGRVQDREQTESLAGVFGAGVFNDVDKMLKSVKPDAVYVTVYPAGHGPIEEAVIRSGAALFVEKPIARDLKTAEKIAALVRARRTVSAVGYHWRYMDTTELALRELKGATLLGAGGGWMGKMPGPPWWRVRRISGGQAVEQTTHVFDVLRYLTGREAVEVYAVPVKGRLRHEVKGFDVDDLSVVTVRMTGGIVASLWSCCAFDFLHTIALEVYAHRKIVTAGLDYASVLTGKGLSRFNNLNDALVDEDKAFLQAIRLGRPGLVRSPYADALMTHRMLMAAARSMETGRAVKVATL